MTLFRDSICVLHLLCDYHFSRMDYYMKVLFVVNWYTPRSADTWLAGVFHYEQSIALQKYCDIRLFWPLDTEVDGLIENTEKGLYTYRSGWNKSKNKLHWFFDSLKYMEKIIGEFEPDIIHANVAYPVGLLCVLAAKKHKRHVVLTEHAPIEQMYLTNPIRRYMRNYVYKKMEKNVCVSIDSKDRLHKYFPKIDYRVIYNAVIDPNTIEKDGISYRKDGCINCAIVAAFYDKEIKGYQFLIPAMQKVKKLGANIKLHICGGGTYEQYYRQLAKELDVEDYCFFYGQCDRTKVYSIVSQMDFCVSSSIFECSGVSVQEEMLLGKPILVTKSGGANSLTTKNTAIVIDRNSTQALVDGLIEMSKKCHEFDKDKIISYAKYNFEISNVTKRYFEMYREVLGNE